MGAFAMPQQAGTSRKSTSFFKNWKLILIALVLVAFTIMLISNVVVAFQATEAGGCKGSIIFTDNGVDHQYSKEGSDPCSSVFEDGFWTSLLSHLQQLYGKKDGVIWLRTIFIWLYG